MAVPLAPFSGIFAVGEYQSANTVALCTAQKLFDVNTAVGQWRCWQPTSSKGSAYSDEFSRIPPVEFAAHLEDRPVGLHHGWIFRGRRSNQRAHVKVAGHILRRDICDLGDCGDEFLRPCCEMFLEGLWSVAQTSTGRTANPIRGQRTSGDIHKLSIQPCRHDKRLRAPVRPQA